MIRAMILVLALIAAAPAAAVQPDERPWRPGRGS